MAQNRWVPRITLELHSLLDAYLPDDAPAERAELEVPVGASPAALLDHLDIPPHRVHLVYVNQQLLATPRWAEVTLEEGDEVVMWPLLAGG